MMIKKLIHIQVVLILLLLASIFVLFWHGGNFYNNRLILKNADNFKPKILVINEFSSSDGKTLNTIKFSARGIIENEKKVLSLGYTVDSYRYHIGDSLYVWSRRNGRVLILRKKNETQFNKQKYKDANKNIILFVFIPIIGIWLSERIVTKKIKQIKKAQNENK
jgi:hypothetical protein